MKKVQIQSFSMFPTLINIFLFCKQQYYILNLERKKNINLFLMFRQEILPLLKKIEKIIIFHVCTEHINPRNCRTYLMKNRRKKNII